MVTLLYGIAIGIVIAFTINEVMLIIARRRIRKQQERFRQSFAGLCKTLDELATETWHRIEDEIEKNRRKSDLTIDERILMAIEDQDYELAAKLRDERDKLKEK